MKEMQLLHSQSGRSMAGRSHTAPQALHLGALSPRVLQWVWEQHPHLSVLTAQCSPGAS